MGTTFPEGKKPKNNVTIFTGNGDVAPVKVDADTGRRVTPPKEEANEVSDRSFAQPNPAIEHVDPKPKTHASEEEEKEAIRRNSTLRRDEEDNTAN